MDCPTNQGACGMFVESDLLIVSNYAWTMGIGFWSSMDDLVLVYTIYGDQKRTSNTIVGFMVQLRKLMVYPPTQSNNRSSWVRCPTQLHTNTPEANVRKYSPSSPRGKTPAWGLVYGDENLEPRLARFGNVSAGRITPYPALACEQ